MENTQLQHHGTKGMKWGVRRYQKSDGSLTAAGKKRYGIVQTVKDYKTKRNRKKALEKARIAKAEKKAAAEKRAKDLEKGRIPIKQMTDAELKARKARLDLEKSVRDLENEAGRTVVSKGRRFINKLVDSTIDKTADNVGADLIAQVLKSYGAKGINTLAGAEIVFANNKKK